MKATAFLTGFGGYVSHFVVQDGVKERVVPVNTQAYMLVYLREAERGRILAGGDLEVPRPLKEKFD